MSIKDRTAEEIEHQAQEIYDHKIRPHLTPTDNGRIVVIDVDTGDYELADSVLAASHQALEKHPEAKLWAIRIGFDAVYSFGGSLQASKQ